MDGKYTADLTSYAGVEEFIDRYAFWCDSVYEFPSLEVGTYTQDMLDRMSIESNFLLRMTYKGNIFTPRDWGTSFLDPTQIVEGGATRVA